MHVVVDEYREAQTTPLENLSVDQVNEFVKNAFLALDEDPAVAWMLSNKLAKQKLNGKALARCNVETLQTFGITAFRATDLIGGVEE